MQDLWFLPKVHLFVLQWRRPQCMWCCPCLLLRDWLHGTFDSLGLWLVSYTFWGYNGAVPGQPANFDNTIVVLETNLCIVFGFLDQWSNNSASFISKATQYDNLGIWWSFHAPYHPLSWWSSKINSKKFLTLPPGPHTSIWQFSHWMWLSPGWDHLP